ncbi:MAG: PDZ domain-containing protein [Candidatus Shapirobacteria bacterium]|jgi:S1-C subfamily serine protease
MKKRQTPKTKKIPSGSSLLPVLSQETIQWQRQNIPLLAGFVIIAACFVLTLTKLSAVKPEPIAANPSPPIDTQSVSDCTPSPDIFSGIGVRLEQVENKVRVQKTIPGSPAEKNDILSGDVIYRVDETPVVDVNDAVARIRGEIGVPVRIILYRNNLRLDKTIVRDNIVDEENLICR